VPLRVIRSVSTSNPVERVVTVSRPSVDRAAFCLDSAQNAPTSTDPEEDAMPSTIERTDVSEPRSAPITHQGGDASTTSTGLERRPSRRRRRAVLGAVAAITTAAAVAAIAVAVMDRSERDPGPHSIPQLVDPPPLAEPWVAAESAAALPSFVDPPPLAEPWVAP
jgi:hypothetical protein